QPPPPRRTARSGPLQQEGEGDGPAQAGQKAVIVGRLKKAEGDGPLRRPAPFAPHREAVKEAERLLLPGGGTLAGLHPAPVVVLPAREGAGEGVGRSTVTRGGPRAHPGAPVGG